MQSEFLFFLAMMVFFFVLWLAGGGPAQPISFAGPYITPITGVDQEQQGYGNSWVPNIKMNVTGTLPGVKYQEYRGNLSSIQNQLSDLQIEAKKQALWSTPSPLRGVVRITGGNFSSTNPDQEYVTIQVSQSAPAPVTITGWRLQSLASDKGATIGRGTKTPSTGTVNGNAPIVLAPGERAYIVTGESPIGASFAENVCTGYLESSQDFYPPLAKRCPAPSEEFDRHFAGNPYKDSACYNLIRNTSTCLVPDDRRSLSGNCLSLIDTYLTYNGCVASHQYDAYFSSDSWRIYLNRTELTRKNDSTRTYGDLWKETRDGIKLLDANGLTVDLYTY